MAEEKEDNFDKVAAGRWVDKVETTYAGAVRIRKCRVKDLRLVSKFIGSIVQQIGLTNDGQYSADLQSTGVVLQLVSNSADEVYQACAALTDKSIEFLEELDLDDGIKVVMRAYELNKDFFWEKVYPLVQPVINLLGIGMQPKGITEEPETPLSTE